MGRPRVPLPQTHECGEGRIPRRQRTPRRQALRAAAPRAPHAEVNMRRVHRAKNKSSFDTSESKKVGEHRRDLQRAENRLQTREGNARYPGLAVPKTAIIPLHWDKFFTSRTMLPQNKSVANQRGEKVLQIFVGGGTLSHENYEMMRLRDIDGERKQKKHRARGAKRDCRPGV